MTQFDPLQEYLLNQNTPTYNAYYNGKMSYALHGKAWNKFIEDNFNDVVGKQTSENVFKAVVDLYAESLLPAPPELRGFSDTLIPLLTRGEAPVIVDTSGAVHYPEHFEMVSDGTFTATAVFTRSLQTMEDYVTFAYSDGRVQVWGKPVPSDLSASDRQGYRLIEETTGNTLFRFALQDKGLGSSLSALQDRVNHSILDQTIIAEMYARPFWYLLGAELPVENPYLQNQPSQTQPMKEASAGDATGRIIVTSATGGFGQLEPPTIGDMIAYHDSIIDKISQTTGIPQFYFKPGSGTPPTGVALKVLSKRFNNRIARIRGSITPELEGLCEVLGVQRGATGEWELWSSADDLLQESLDSHGLALSQMGYPLDYVAEVVTPGVDLEEYTDDGLQESLLNPVE